LAGVGELPFIQDEEVVREGLFARSTKEDLPAPGTPGRKSGLSRSGSELSETTRRNCKDAWPPLRPIGASMKVIV
jgi:hypothetical protein